MTHEQMLNKKVQQSSASRAEETTDKLLKGCGMNLRGSAKLRSGIEKILIGAIAQKLEDEKRFLEFLNLLSTNWIIRDECADLQKSIKKLEGVK